MIDILILGGGYVGKPLGKSLSNSLVTYRSTREERAVFFNLHQQESWENLPRAKNVAITFALYDQDIDLLESFYSSYLYTCQRIYLYSTTSIYRGKKGELDEQSPLDTAHNRYKVEKFLWGKGAIILPLSGICGGKREPKNWLLQNKIKNGLKMVNLIHVDDIVALTKILLEKEVTKQQRINLTAGAYRWDKIAKKLGLAVDFEQNILQERVISNKKILGLVGKDYQFTNPYLI